MIRVKLSLLLFTVLLQGQSGIEIDRPCLDCHQSGTWYPLPEVSSFDHDVDTEFHLNGVHTTLNCAQCHSGASIEAFHQFDVSGSECSDCHQDVHQNFWGNRCERCHSTHGWNPEMSYQAHDQTLFPLLGGHFSIECYLCHTASGQTPPLDCQKCHEADFQADIGAHAGLSAQNDCSTCHAPTTWDQILAINHDVFFPIYSGNHRGEWESCASCHQTPGEYHTFTCFGSGCHNVSRMNSEHCEENNCERCDGLTYPRTGVTADDCFFCHPQGNESKCGD